MGKKGKNALVPTSYGEIKIKRPHTRKVTVVSTETFLGICSKFLEHYEHITFIHTAQISYDQCDAKFYEKNSDQQNTITQTDKT